MAREAFHDESQDKSPPASLSDAAPVAGDPRPNGNRVLVVMPAYNAALTLTTTCDAISRAVVDEVLLVDDGSRDATLKVAAGLPIRTIGLPHNVGYGGNQKICYLEALRLGAEIVVMLHPDGQYNPSVLPDLIAPIQKGEADLVLGSRMLGPGSARAGQMPLYRYVSNKVPPAHACPPSAAGTADPRLDCGGGP